MYYVLVEGVRVFKHEDKLLCTFLSQRLRYKLHDFIEVELSTFDPVDCDHNREELITRMGEVMLRKVQKFFVEQGKESNIPRGLQYEDNPEFNEYLEEQAYADILDGENPFNLKGFYFSQALFVLDRTRYDICYEDYPNLMEEEDNA